MIHWSSGIQQQPCQVECSLPCLELLLSPSKLGEALPPQKCIVGKGNLVNSKFIFHHGLNKVYETRSMQSRFLDKPPSLFCTTGHYLALTYSYISTQMVQSLTLSHCEEGLQQLSASMPHMCCLPNLTGFASIEWTASTAAQLSPTTRGPFFST